MLWRAGTCRFGLLWMYFFDTGNHHVPHTHVEYGEFSVALAIANGEIWAVRFPNQNANARRLGRQFIAKIWLPTGSSQLRSAMCSKSIR